MHVGGSNDEELELEMKGKAGKGNECHGKGVNGAENACECMLELHKEAGKVMGLHGIECGMSDLWCNDEECMRNGCNDEGIIWKCKVETQKACEDAGIVDVHGKGKGECVGNACDAWQGWRKGV